MASTFSIVSAVRIAACASTVLGIALPAGAQAPTAVQAAPAAQAQEVRAELDKLRKEFESIRDTYGARLAALESKLSAMDVPAVPGPPTQLAAAPAPPTVPPDVQVPTGAAGAGGPSGTLQVPGTTGAASKVFNPDMAVIGNFVGAAGRNTVAPIPALALQEAEATFQAVVDPYARGDFFLSFSPDGVEIEEGFVTLTALPGGLLAKLGKLKEQVGKVNTMHAHALPWVDEPLMVTNIFGSDEGLADSGISVSKLIPNQVMFLEATGEIYAGTSGQFKSYTRSDVSWVGRLRAYRDMTEGTNLDVGGSFAYGTNDAGPEFTTRLVGMDATFRYRPLRRAIYRRFQGRTELFWSRRGQEGGTVEAFGMYGSADYQFARRWFSGVRYDWSERNYDASLVDKGPSLVLTYWPSEFSQIRGQYRRTRYAENVTANELLFQFLFSIGAHGAHVF